ncbi:unnamed protein product [Sphagnum compactum]
MKALAELCDVLAETDPASSTTQKNVALLRSQCPASGSSFFTPGVPLTTRQCNGLLATARYLAKAPQPLNQKEFLSLILDFVNSVPALSRDHRWPSSFTSDSLDAFFTELLSYTSQIARKWPGTSCTHDVSHAIAEIIQYVTTPEPDESSIKDPTSSPNLRTQASQFSKLSSLGIKSFVIAVVHQCPALLASDAELIAKCLLQQWLSPQQLLSPHEPSDQSSNSRVSSSTGDESPNAQSSSNFFTPPSVSSKGSATSEDLGSGSGEVNGTNGSRRGDFVGGGNKRLRQLLASLDAQSLEALERQELAFRLLLQVLAKGGGAPLKDELMLLLRAAAIGELSSILPLLRIRKRDWPVDGLSLMAKMNMKLQGTQAATMVIVELLTLSRDEKPLQGQQPVSSLPKALTTKETLSLLMDVADACMGSPWRRLKSSESLFEALLSAVTRVAASQGNKMLKILLLRVKNLVLAACAQADAWAINEGHVFSSVRRAACTLIEVAWNSDRAAIESFLLSLAAYVREHLEQEKTERQVAAVTQLNIIPLLTNMIVMLNKAEAVNMIMPLFIESLEEGDASVPSLVRLRVLDAVARMACLGSDKAYREVVVLLTQNYVSKLSVVGSSQSRTLAPEAMTERLETLPGAFLHIAQCLKEQKLRSDFRHRLLSLYSDVGLVAEAKNGRAGADLLGPLLPAVAEICSDLEPTHEVEPSLLKLLRNLWFYIVMFGLAPPIQKGQPITLPRSMSSGSQGTITIMQTVGGPYMWNLDWSTAVHRLTQFTPPLVVSSVRWLEDELELDALHNPGSYRGSGNERAAAAQRTLLSTALGGRVEVSSLSGVKATYLLAVAFLEILRLGHHGGLLVGTQLGVDQRSGLTCVFKYLEAPNLPSDLYQCLTAILHCAFNAALTWLDGKASSSGSEVEEKERVLTANTCFLIRYQTHHEATVRELASTLLSQLRSKFPQVLWNGQCLEALLQLLSEQSAVADGESQLAFRTSMHQQVREWITHAFLLAPSTTQGLLQEYIRQVGTWQNLAQSSDIISLLSEIQLDTSNSTLAIVPALKAAAAAAAGGDLGSMDVLSVAIASANIKSNYTGEVAGMKRIFGESLGGLMLADGHHSGKPSLQLGLNGTGSTGKINREGSLHSILTSWFMQHIQQFVTDAQGGLSIDGGKFREACLQATALLLSDKDKYKDGVPEITSQLLRLLCWCPAHIFTPGAMETGVFVWTWLLAASPQLGPLVLAELVDAWLWTITSRRGLFADGAENSGPAAFLCPQLVAGESKPPPAQDPTESIAVHRVWLGFLLDRFEVVRHTGSDQLLLLVRLMQASMQSPNHFSSHPAAAGAFFTLLLLGLKLCDCLLQSSTHTERLGVNLLRDRVYRAAFSWFSVEPGWFESKIDGMAQAEAQAVALFTQMLTLERPESNTTSSQDDMPHRHSSRSGSLTPITTTYTQPDDHPVWGKGQNDLSARDRRKQLLLMLCQHEADRLDSWAYPLKEHMVTRFRPGHERWGNHVRTAWAVDPQIALALVARFPGVASLKSEVSSMVQAHIPDLCMLPEALPYLVTPQAVEEDSNSLNWLPHWAPCSITQALEFLTPPYKGHKRVMAYVLRVMEMYPPQEVTFFVPQLVQSLRYDHGGLVESYLMVAAQQSNLFAHILIWQLQGEEPPSSEDVGKEGAAMKGNKLYDIVPRVKRRIIDSFTPDALDIYQREFRFFEKVTAISGVLYPLPKDERRAQIRRELEKIEVEGDDLYLPTAPGKLVKGIEIDSGIPLQSAAKVPIMITFDVVEKDGDPNEIHCQKCIFKVGDDSRQDVLALQVICLLKNIWEAVGLDLYLFPYGVLPTGFGKAIMEVVPNTRSRNEMGEMTDGGLYELYQQDFGPVGSPRFEEARNNFIVSSAGYAVASLLLQPKDRHNGNLLFDSEGRLVHIDFGFILETSPGGNLRFESAQFKLSHEMTQLIDPSGTMKSETWYRFVRLCVKGYLAARVHMEGIVNTVLLMVDSGLPCFSRGDPIGNLRKRFHPEMSEREAAIFMRDTCIDAYNKWSTAGYDLIQYLQQGIER